MKSQSTLPDNFLLQHGKYRVERFLSSGGFGCTYKGVHVMMNRPIAIKEFFVGDFCERDEATHGVRVVSQSKVDTVAHLKRKFIEEAQALFSFNHPGIVRVTDIFEENSTAYFVMDFIDGKSLEQIIKERGPLPEKEALKYICQAADALAYVHAHNRLHLDVKPANLMIDAAGNAILIDFGVSKQYDRSLGSNTSTLIGLSPGYASIEQMSNDVTRFNAATDVYSLGATLYALLTGHAPKTAPLLASGERLDPLPSSVSKATANAVMRALSLNKSQRQQSMAEFRQSLTSSVKSAHVIQQQGHENDSSDTVNISFNNSNQPAKNHRKGKSLSSWMPLIIGALFVAIVLSLMLFKGFGCARAATDYGNCADSVVAVTEEYGPFIDTDANGFKYMVIKADPNSDMGFREFQAHVPSDFTARVDYESVSFFGQFILQSQRSVYIDYITVLVMPIDGPQISREGYIQGGYENCYWMADWGVDRGIPAGLGRYYVSMSYPEYKARVEIECYFHIDNFTFEYPSIQDYEEYINKDIAPTVWSLINSIEFSK